MKWDRSKINVVVFIVFITVITILNVNIMDIRALSSIQIEPEKHILKIYSPLNERIIQPIVKEFQESTGIQVEYTSAGTLDLLNALENKGEKYLMDIMWGGSEDYLRAYNYLFEPIERIDGSKDCILRYNRLPIVLIYNIKLVSPEEVPASWKEVLTSKWRGKLAMADPKASGSAYITLSFLLELGRRGNEYNWLNAKKLIQNINGKILAKSSEVYEGVAAGDFSIGISMEEAAINYIKKNKDIGIVYLEEGTPVIDDSIALMKDAKNKDEAKAFIDFVLNKKVQSYMVDRFYLRSVRNDIDAPIGLLPMGKINVFDASKLTTYENKDAILMKWQSLLDVEDKDDE
jgi:iron(III) transport system substrate-binding protein